MRYNGTQVAAAGSLITILDLELTKNANWTIFDAAAGANAKVYKCGKAGAEFYLYVDDNYVGYAIVQIWEAWDAVGHTGIGVNSTSVTAYWRKSGTGAAPQVYWIHLEDERVIYTIFGTNINYSHFAGNVERFNTGYNIPILIGVRATTTTGINPLGGGGLTTTYGWAAVNITQKFVNQCCAVGFATATPAAQGFNIWKDNALNFHIHENRIAIPYYNAIIGVMRGVMSLGSTVAAVGVAHGDTVTVGGQVWDIHGSTPLALLKRA